MCGEAAIQQTAEEEEEEEESSEDKQGANAANCPAEDGRQYHQSSSPQRQTHSRANSHTKACRNTKHTRSRYMSVWTHTCFIVCESLRVCAFVCLCGMTWPNA